MKLRRLFFAFFLLLAAFQFCFSQEKPKAILIDEFGKANCEELFSRFSNFLGEVNSEPDSIGYVVIYEKKEDLYANDLYRKLIRGYVDSLNQEKQIIVVKGNAEESLKTQLWKVPLNAEKPFLFESWNLSLPKFTKSIKLYDDSEEGACQRDDGVLNFSEFLLANTTLHGNLVIYEPTLKEFRQTEKSLLERFENKYRVSPNRLKTFYVNNNKKDKYGVEYWLVKQN